MQPDDLCMSELIFYAGCDEYAAERTDRIKQWIAGAKLWY